MSEYEYEQFENMSFAERMKVIDSWNDEYEATLKEIKEHTEALKNLLGDTQEKAP